MTGTSPPPLPTSHPSAPASEPPGPRRRYPGEFLRLLATDKLGLFGRMAKHGDVTQIRIGPRRVALLTHPDDIRRVLITHPRTFHKGRALGRTKTLLGEGLLTAEGDFHLRERRLVQPAFHRERFAAYGMTMVQHAERMQARWRDGEVHDIHADMMHLTLAIAGQTLFNADIERDARDVEEAMHLSLRMFNYAILPGGPLLEYLPLPWVRRLHAARARMDALIFRLIAERRADVTDRGDLLSMLIAARDDEGDETGMSDRQLRDEVVTLLMAGHETTANALTWSWHLLSQHPAVEAKLHAELDAVLLGQSPTPAHLPRLTYTRSVMAESMRLRPPAWILERRAVEDFEAGGYTIRRGTTVLLPQYIVHRDPRWWGSDADRFDPERWAPEHQAARNRFAYFPFGAGTRICVAEHFAWMEGTLVLAAIARRWRLRCEATEPPVLEPLVTLRPAGGLRMRLVRRGSALAVACAMIVATACRAPAPAPAAPLPPVAAPAASPPATGRRAILLAIDSFNEQRARTTLDAAAIPAITSLFDRAACAASARPAFPSVTSPGLASLWTGAYGDASGISANWQPMLPRDRHTLLDGESGYRAGPLRAEPIWITAGAEGVRVTAHHVTQAPSAPGYRPIRGERDAGLEAAHWRATDALERPGVSVINGYNHTPIRDTLITELAARPVPARGWRGVSMLRSGRPPLEVAWKSGPDSLFALLLGDRGYTHMIVAAERDASGGVAVMAVPVRRAAPDAERLAEHFSGALELRREHAPPVYARFRLFELAPDGTRFTLFQPAIHIVDMNRPDVRDGFTSAVRGWTGNGAGVLYERGAFGPTLANGGDGTAESMYLESLENVTARFIEGSTWAWRETQPTLLIDYFPLADEIDHRFLGYLDRAHPGHDDTLAGRMGAVRRRAWSLVDFHVANLRRLAGDDPRVALFISGDHGMRATWRMFSPNVALVEAGLLVLDTEGRVDLGRTKVLSPNGYWVMVNTTDWQRGIVPPDERTAVIDAAERALLAVRSPGGERVVTKTWRAADHDSLGLGGPVGGDLYYDVARGYRWNAEKSGPVVRDASVTAEHGYPSPNPEMHTVFCAWGPAFRPVRGPVARTIDVAPTVSEWLGIAPPPDARGRSVLGLLLP